VCLQLTTVAQGRRLSFRHHLVASFFSGNEARRSQTLDGPGLALGVSLKRLLAKGARPFDWIP
jgi:hypothetical protein